MTDDALAEKSLDALYTLARRGDARALEALCERMRPRLYRTAFSILKDPDEADDVAQDALVRALARRLTFLGWGSVEGWMARIALNLARNRFRDRRRRRELEQEHQAVMAVGAHGQGPRAAEHLVLDDERRRALEAALTALGERQRTVLELRLYGELSFAEIAETLRISEANARVTASQAQKKLLGLLEGEHGGER